MSPRHVLAIAAVAAFSVGCSGGGGTAGEVSVSDTVVVDPADTADVARFDFTSTITITASGFEPSAAVAVFGETLTFVNATTVEQTIRFTNGVPNIDGPGSIGPIPPGGQVSMDEPLETSVSLVYESDALPGVTGRLQVDPGVGEL